MIWRLLRFVFGRPTPAPRRWTLEEITRVVNEYSDHAAERGFSQGYYEGYEDAMATVDGALRKGVEPGELRDWMAVMRAKFDQHRMEL